MHAVALAGLDANWKALRERTPPDARPAKRIDLTEKDAHTLASQLYGQIVGCYESNPSAFQWNIGVGEKLGPPSSLGEAYKKP